MEYYVIREEGERRKGRDGRLMHMHVLDIHTHTWTMRILCLSLAQTYKQLMLFVYVVCIQHKLTSM